MSGIRNSTIFLFAVAMLLVIGGSVTLAATGTIDPAYKYAWSNMGGWVNFAPTMSTVSVSDSSLTGYVWSQNDGWINLSPSGSGVQNDGTGNLSGYAWNSSRGWISFSGVTIDADGNFNGSATGDDGYVLAFDCTNCAVKTDWQGSVVPAPDSGGTTGSRARSEDTATTSAAEPSHPPSVSDDNEIEPPSNYTAPSSEEPVIPPVSVSEEIRDDIPQNMPVKTESSVPPQLSVSEPFTIPHAAWYLIVALLIIVAAYTYRRIAS